MESNEDTKSAQEFKDVPGIVNEKLSLLAFQNFAGVMAGYPFIKVVVQRESGNLHFINHHCYGFHVDYVAECILGKNKSELRGRIDEFNQKNYLQPERDYYLGIVSLQENAEKQQFFALETQEIDNLDGEMICEFFDAVLPKLDKALPLVFKPANHLQEATVSEIERKRIPRIYNHELFASKKFIALNEGSAEGRLRLIKEDDFPKVKSTIKWYDIIVMDKVPEDIPRVSGIINTCHTTPLSHTNVLACGWQIPNAIEIEFNKVIEKEGLDGQWVQYDVGMNDIRVSCKKIEPKAESDLKKPAWHLNRITLEQPEIEHTKIRLLSDLRMSDRYRYGTKAANIGELYHILKNGSPRLTGFYRVPRPPRENLLPYLSRILQGAEGEDLEKKSVDFLRKKITVPRGISLPFSFQQDFLVTSPKIQQAIGKLKMALELGVHEIETLCFMIQKLIQQTKISDAMRAKIDTHISIELAGVSNFVVRSSSNAEDLANFSAAGIYESTNHVSTADKIFQSVKDVWASLISPRSVRLRQEVGISLDDSYMGVIIQEEVQSDMGGVLVTTNPMNTKEFRNVFINASPKSAVEIVEGSHSPFQYLFNTLEGGGRTLSIGDSKADLSDEKKSLLQDLAYCGRLFQSHYSQNYLFDEPLDIEWATFKDEIYILQIRPYTV